VFIDDFKDGCPDIKLAAEEVGYRGRIRMHLDSSTRLAIPAGEPIVIEPIWDSYGKRCRTPATFTPEAGGQYVLDYSAPTWAEDECHVTASKAITGASGATARVRPERVGYTGPHEAAAFFVQSKLCSTPSDTRRN
jgi:hypothetical protein